MKRTILKKIQEWLPPILIVVLVFASAVAAHEGYLFWAAMLLLIAVLEFVRNFLILANIDNYDKDKTFAELIEEISNSFF